MGAHLVAQSRSSQLHPLNVVRDCPNERIPNHHLLSCALGDDVNHFIFRLPLLAQGQDCVFSMRWVEAL